MKKTITALALMSLIAIACGEKKSDSKDTAAKDGKDAPAATSSKEDVPKKSGLDGKETLALAEAYADAVCACKDAMCINKAGDKYHADVNKLYEDKKLRTPTPEQKKKMDAAQARVKECTNKLLKK